MSRIKLVTRETANPDQKALLDTIQKKLGMVPNFLNVMAHSPDALQAFLGLNTLAEAGLLDPKIRQSIALVVAQDNSCEYCLSAHSAMGRKAGLSNSEIEANRSGTSEDAKAAAAVTFAHALNKHMGDMTQAEFDAIRDAGFSDAEIVEIIIHVGMNILTNLLGKAVQVDIDFPKVSAFLEAA